MHRGRAQTAGSLKDYSEEAAPHTEGHLHSGAESHMKSAAHNWIRIIGVLTTCFAGKALIAAPSDSTVVVKEIRIEGNEKTKAYVILREMESKVGEPLSAEELKLDEQRVYNLQLFNRVDIGYYVEGNEATVIVSVHERWYFFPFPVLGFKYREIKNLYYGAGVAHLNFRGRNEKLSAAFALGFDRWIDVTYQNPKITSDDDIFVRLSADAARLQNLRPDRGFYDQEKYAGNLLLGKRFGLHQTLSGWIYYEVWLVPTDVPDGTISSSGRDAFPTFGIGYTYDSRNLREYPTDGRYISLQVSKSGLTTSGVNFFRYGYDLRGYFPTFWGTSFGMRTFGTFSAGPGIPPYRYLYYGYDERIRGHFNRIQEGEHIVGGFLELRIPILSPRYFTFPYAIFPEFSLWRYGVYAGIFADAGKTWYRYEPFHEKSWYTGFGAGIHFLLPYSFVVRTEYALNGEGVGEFVLDFGASF